MRLLRPAVLPTVIAAIGAAELVSLHPPRLLTGIALETAACAILVFRRYRPLITCTAAVLTVLLLPYGGPAMKDAAVPILIIALSSFSLARYLPWHRSLLGMAIILVALLVTQQLTFRPPPTFADAVFIVVVLTPGYAFGLVTRRLAASHAEQTRLIVREQEAQQREAVAAERARIARDLHDILAHSISAMVVQAEAASDLVATSPDRAVAALGEVTQTGRSALAETGRLLGLIRDHDNELDLIPDGGLSGLAELVDRFSRSGLHVDMEVRGALDGLPAAVSTAGQRIVREALTNALRHGPDRAVRLSVFRTATELTITATNRAAARDPGDGLGLVGMRERVAILGGSVNHAVEAGDRFRLTAVLPLTPATV